MHESSLNSLMRGSNKMRVGESCMTTLDVTQSLKQSLYFAEPATTKCKLVAVLQLSSTLTDCSNLHKLS